MTTINTKPFSPYSRIKQYFIMILCLYHFYGGDAASRTITLEKEGREMKTVSIKIDSIRIPPVLWHANKIIIVDDKLVSLSLKDDTLVKVFNLPNLQYLGGFGKIGNGPTEYISPNISSFNSYKNYLSIFDLKYQRVICMPDGRISEKSIEVIDQRRISGLFSDFNYAHQLSDSLICGLSGGPTMKELQLYNKYTGEELSYIDFPNIYKNVPSNLISMLYQKQVTFSPDKTQVAFTYTLFPLIRLFTSKGDKIKEIETNEGPKQKKFEFTRNSIGIIGKNTYYRQLTSSNHHVFALFDCYTIQDGTLERKAERTIHIVDWAGETVRKLLLDKRFTGFAITPDSKRIYLFDPNVSNYVFFANLNL